MLLVTHKISVLQEITLLKAQEAGRYQFSMLMDGTYGSNYCVAIYMQLDGKLYQTFRHAPANDYDSGYFQTEIQMVEGQKITFYTNNLGNSNFVYYSHPYSFIEGKRTR